MALEGFLQEFGLADILQLIYFQKKTGILNIEGKDRIKLSLIDGNITQLESEKRLEEKKLGRILIKKGLITQSNLDTALELQKHKDIKIGHIFLRERLISRQVLMETLQSQIIETIAHIFTWSEGRYEFIPQEIRVDKELPVSLDTQHLLMDGLRIVDEWSLIEGKLNLESVFKHVKKPETKQLNDVEETVLNLIDGESDVSTIISVSPAGDFETSKALISLKEKGIIAPIVVKPVKVEKAIPVRVSGLQFRIIVVAIAGVISFFAFKGDVDSFKVFKRAWIVSKIERLKTEVDIYNITNGHYPEEIETITTERDVWGRPYIYRQTEGGFKLYSVGPDGVEGTKDDVY